MKKNKYKILVSAIPLVPIFDQFKKYFDKNKYSIDLKKTDQYLNEFQLSKIINKYDGVICGDDEFSKKVLSKAVNLKVISKWGTGINSIDLDYAKRKKIRILNTPSAFSYSVATMAVGMILAYYRKIIENHTLIKKNIWPKPEGQTLLKKKIGVIGVGNIGKKIFQMLSGFETIDYANDLKKINQSFLKKYKIKQVSKNKIFQNCDIIITASDLNKSSFHLINRRTLKKMKKNVLIVNISRGSLIDNDALIEFLKKNNNAGACLDVFEQEPLNKNSKFLSLKNCIFTSHNAFNTVNEVEKTHINTINNILKILR
jgi:phosphoglycerate dehydrogenase-like enzyme